MHITIYQHQQPTSMLHLAKNTNHKKKKKKFIREISLTLQDIFVKLS